MGYWVYLQEARVVIPHERQPLALAALKRLVGDFPWVINEHYFHAETFAETLQDLRWRPVQDRAGNIFTLEFNGQKLSNDRSLFETLAPFVEPGSYVLIEGEDNSRWTWTFDGLQVHLWQTRLEAAKALGKLEGPIPRTTLDLLLELRYDRESSAVREAAHEALEAILARETDILEDLHLS